ncbi:DUF2806 domain-containing protein [Microbulbifer sp. SH-1]|uniref:DUF2806 domain-containing protein n=1 Tax=Microbulbifer sp. SH-1 TaxID=2681547 RepID=UPI001408E660|nr:DUF2806 domain-containing protein [Microbulbifer sp. SH-1]QIL91392.1 DUF2806 domain-containing protein [Microbulbifer sp. SH-1]
MDYPGEKLLLKMWETLAEKGVGSLLAPWQEKRIAAARAEIRRREMLTLAQAEREVEAIKAGKSAFQINPERKLLGNSTENARGIERIEPTLDLSVMAESIANRDLSDSIRKETNVARAIIKAEDILRNDKQDPPGDELDDDWLYSWRDYAGRVSVDELQDMWGRILAGEVKQPGSYSLRTLEFLKGLSRQEAVLISSAAKFVVGGRIYRKKDEFLEREGIQFAHLMLLQDIGVLSGVEAIGLNTTYQSSREDRFFRPLVAANKALLVEHENASKVLKSEVYLLTQVGLEILKIASFHVDEGYLMSVAQDFVKQGYTVTVGDWVQETADRGSILNPQKVMAPENA